MKCKWCGRNTNLATDSEATVCDGCGLTWRATACLIAVLDGLGYSGSTIGKDIATDLSRVGLGIGDDWRLARCLYQIFRYTNTQLYSFPNLDLLNIPESAKGQFEFVVCSDVLEHVHPPMSRATDGLFELLKPGGFAVVTVPLTNESAAAEFYPDLQRYEEKDGIVTWVDKEGVERVDESPEFHGGEGLVLAFRIFSHDGLLVTLKDAGFTSVVSPQAVPQINGHDADHNRYNVYIARKGL